MAQVYIWKDGMVIWSMASGTPDSITFEDPLARFRFSVAADRKVRFAPGNLQYNDYLYEWRFASTQYEVIGLANSNIASMYEGWIDLFGWGSSGWGGMDWNAIEPYETSTDYTSYIVGNSWSNGLTGDFVAGDWGVNDIGDDASMTWRIPTSAEWGYLLNTRPNADKLFALGIIGTQKGLIILPDTWQLPSGLTFTPSAGHRLKRQGDLYQDNDMIEDNYTDNIYTTAQWTIMEAAGAVFLPAAGRRNGTSVLNFTNNPWGLYWTSTPTDEEREGNVHDMSFYMSGVTPLAATTRIYGCSVRLIRED